MKYLLVIGLLLLVGCSKSQEDIDKEEREKRAEMFNKNTQAPVQTDVTQPSPEPEKPAEPECTTTQLVELYIDNKFITACGEVKDNNGCIEADSCDDGFVYPCLNKGLLKYKRIERQSCDKKE